MPTSVIALQRPRQPAATSRAASARVLSIAGTALQLALFYTHDIAATGVDAVLKQADVSVATLHAPFGS